MVAWVVSASVGSGGGGTIAPMPQRRKHRSTTPQPPAPAGAVEIRPGMPAADAATLLFDAYAPMVLRLGQRLGGSLAEAEEIVQETFLRAFRRFETFDGRSRPSTWLYTIAVRVWQRRHRGTRGREQRMPSLDAVMPFHEQAIADLRDDRPLGRALANEAIAGLEGAIAGLPETFRLPILFKEILELSIEETAAVLGVKAATVKTRLHRARLLLRKALLERVPTRGAPLPSYDRQTCIDLLRAKLDSMDRGGPFPLQEGIVCERCRGVFRELDLASELCRRLDGPGSRREIQRVLKRLAGSMRPALTGPAGVGR